MLRQLLVHHLYFMRIAMRRYVFALEKATLNAEKRFLYSCFFLCLTPFLIYWPIIYFLIGIPSLFVFIVDGWTILQKMMWLHRHYFCCGEGGRACI